MPGWEIWPEMPTDKHTWAFYYYLKRCGDHVEITNRTQHTMDLKVFMAFPPVGRRQCLK